MRASVILALAGACGLGALCTGACLNFKTSGQGGDPGSVVAGTADGSVGAGSGGGGSGSGGTSSGVPGTSSGGATSGSGGSGSGGGLPSGSGGSSSSGGVVIDDAGTPPTSDAGTNCQPTPSFQSDCLAFYRDQDAGAACTSCVQPREQGCGTPLCGSGGDINCSSSCTAASNANAFCNCLIRCSQMTGGGGACCLQLADQFFTCVTGPCAPSCRLP